MVTAIAVCGATLVVGKKTQNTISLPLLHEALVDGEHVAVQQRLGIHDDLVEEAVAVLLPGHRLGTETPPQSAPGGSCPGATVTRAALEAAFPVPSDPSTMLPLNTAS